MKRNIIRSIGRILHSSLQALPMLLICAGVLALVYGEASAAGADATPAPSFQKAEPATRPYMGWSSWSTMRRHVTAAKIEEQARVMAERLKPFGYTYINVDSGWCNGYDDKGEIYPNHYDEYGRPIPNPTEFPDGMAAVATHVHALGLKFGIYLSPGLKVSLYEANSKILGTSHTVREIADRSRWGSTFPHTGPQAFRGSYAIDYSKPGAQEFIQSEADLFASWGVDFIKIDWTTVRGGAHPVDDRADIEQWAIALKKTGRPIWLELSAGQNIDYADIWTKYANGCRIDGDIEAYGKSPDLTNWRRIMTRFKDAPKWAGYPRPGYWNDLDSLEIGDGPHDGLTAVEKQSAMTLWCISCAPLFTGADLTHLDPDDFKMLTNREVIAIDQAGHVATPISQATPQQVWRVKNPDGSITVALFNLANASAKVTALWSDLGLQGSAQVHDLWSHSDLGDFEKEFSASLEPHACRLLTVKPAKSK